MLDGLLKSKFYSKCKKDIKLTKTRIEMIRRKRNSMQKYLKKDIADLLKNGLDSNAYGRAEGLLVELNMTSCYDFVEQSCVCISTHLSAMNKQRECPEECREAVPSLMFAAARFADLPELRELRSIFAEKYGNSLESFVNKEFVQKLKLAPPTKDMNFQLIQDIALEFGIEWDSKGLEQWLYKPPVSAQDWSKNANDDKNNEYNQNVGKTNDQGVGYDHSDLRDYTVKERNQEDHPSHGRKEVTGDDRKNSPTNEGTQQASNNGNGLEKNTNPVKSASEEVVEGRNHLDFKSIPPPYTKPKVTNSESSSDVSHTKSAREETAGTKEKGHLDGKADNHHQDESVNKTKPVPRSVRRRPLKPPPGHETNAGSLESVARGEFTKSEKQPEKSMQGAKKILNDEDVDNEEERVMDKLLMHNSKKPGPSEPVIVESGSIKYKSRDGLAATRTTSLQAEPTTLTTEATTKVQARAASFHSETVSPSGHVHPKLPDYEDFVARLAALRGNSK